MSSLPGWCVPLPDAAAQRSLDEWAIGERGIPGLTLMERAGGGLARIVSENAQPGDIVVVCGKGNNGGDGFVAARHLLEDGHRVRVLLLGEPEDLRGDARANYERLPTGASEPYTAERLQGAGAIIDAILGTGTAGAPRGTAAEAIDSINARSASTAVIACDVPSGVDASTGEVPGTAVNAIATVTFHAGKPGLWIHPGKTHAGTVTVIDIGIPDRGEIVSPDVGLIGAEVTAEVPRRGAASTKFTAGAVLVCGGSPGLTGAPCMAAMGAMRAGAGYVTAAVPASLAAVFESKLLEVMVAPLRDEQGAHQPTAIDDALERVARVQSVVLGPGIGRTPLTAAFVRELALAVAPPLVLDADGLNAFAGDTQSLAQRSGVTVLTPHAGELARLLAIKSEQVGERRLHWVRHAARTAGAVVVLKGDDTLVGDPSGRVAVSRGGAPALATAGSGDVLSGVIGAYLAKGMDPFAAAAAAVYVHAAAARLVARELGDEGVIASDVISVLPRVLDRAEG